MVVIDSDDKAAAKLEESRTEAAKNPAVPSVSKERPLMMSRLNSLDF
jgi:hypothetical protein